MNVFQRFEDRIRSILGAVAAREGWTVTADLLERVIAEPPRDPAHGDVATNAALALSKPLALKPRDLASLIAAELRADPDVTAVEVAGPGFINLRLSDAFWAAELRAILCAGDRYGRAEAASGQAVNVEFVSANPTGPMHVGHCRGAVVGDVIASMLEATGDQVTREYYINDAGGQIDMLARSVFLRYREALGEEIGEIPRGLYPGDYLKPVGEALRDEFADGLLHRAEPDWMPLVKERAIAAMMAMIKADLAALGVRHDVFFSERSLTSGGEDKVAAVVEVLRAKGLIYTGTLPPPKGQLPDDWEDREQTLFRATEFGDDIDRPLMKSDGSYTYFASDIAYHYDKFLRGFTDMIDVWGADHSGYIKRLRAAVTAMSDGKATLEVQICQLVKLFRGGEPVKMSKRSGDLVTLREVVDEVGRSAVRFMMLFRKADAPLDFDFQVVTEKSKDNPVFYVQYAHARTASVRRQAGEEVPDVDLSPSALAAARLELLTDEGERALVRQMADWPRLLEAAARSREPHRIAYYLHELASTFHAHWNRGKELPQLRFIKPEDLEVSRARLALVTALGAVLRDGLGILGVEAPDEMH
ncbi:arginine--tRNA ligase [Propylenella binzhouense]|uniref:Arginine--tRNA ligase n=1 Tax=Propylenella binzhouense TaxID=2555902 RepID=A0A964WVM0_9HYPH|nr:arginine--tRNA ligase [Propylenella binzhouense]MYZ50193.1 arginine--tRNA ligase [Propylenella binzhouense]